METANFIVGSLLVVLGFLVKKYPDLIAGYNTMSPEQKEKVDIDGLSTHMRNSLVVIGALVVLITSLLNFIGWQQHSSGASISIILIGTGYMWINAYTYTNKSKNQQSKKIIRTVTRSVVFAGLALLIFGFLYYGTRAPEFTVTNHQIVISGLYGMTDQVERIELIESIPKIKKKTNGFNYGSTLKGNFDLENIGPCKLFLKSPHGPFVYVITERATPIILNTVSRKETEELFGKLIAELEKQEYPNYAQ